MTRSPAHGLVLYHTSNQNGSVSGNSSQPRPEPAKKTGAAIPRDVLGLQGRDGCCNGEQPIVRLFLKRHKVGTT